MIAYGHGPNNNKNKPTNVTATTTDVGGGGRLFDERDRVTYSRFWNPAHALPPLI